MITGVILLTEWLIFNLFVNSKLYKPSLFYTFMDDQLQELESTFLEEYESAQLLLRHQKTKSAIILLSKSLFSLLDYLIFDKYHKLPKNHTERFRVLEEREPKLYILVDEVWKSYRDSYSKPAAEKSLHVLQKAITEVIGFYERYSQKIKATVKK